jgi:hypothetical protein
VELPRLDDDNHVLEYVEASHTRADRNVLAMWGTNLSVPDAVSYLIDLRPWGAQGPEREDATDSTTVQWSSVDGRFGPGASLTATLRPGRIALRLSAPAGASDVPPVMVDGVVAALDGNPLELLALPVSVDETRVSWEEESRGIVLVTYRGRYPRERTSAMVDGLSRREGAILDARSDGTPVVRLPAEANALAFEFETSDEEGVVTASTAVDLSRPLTPFTFPERGDVDVRGDTELPAAAPAAPGTSTGPPVTLLVSSISEWAYDDSGSQPRGWQRRVPEELRWRTGFAPFRVGDPERTTATELAYPSPTHVTTAFVHRFLVDDADALDGVFIEIEADDGATIWINGQEVFRDNVPPGPVTSTTLATAIRTGSDELEISTATIPPSVLTNGENIIAVLVHQSAPDSSDIAFDLELYAT